MSEPICRIRLFNGSISRDDKTYELTFVADDPENAQVLCDVFGLQYESECVAIIDDNNGGEKVTLFSDDGMDMTNFEEKDKQ